jgi:hydroxypyruvate reductase
VIIVKEGHVTGLGQHSPVRILEASHPLPDERGVQGAQQLIDLLKGVGPDDLVIGLISGGGSALLTSPAPGLSLGDLQALTSALLACGANINEINTLRKHLDLVKGGGLAQWVAPARLATLILSDVVGDPLDVIASGPTVPDPTTFAEALGVIEKYQIGAKTPSAVIDRLQQGAAGNIPDTPKPGDPLFERVQNVIVGSNRQAAEAALAQAQAEGLYPLLLTTYLQGEARQVGRVLAGVARQVASSGQPIARPACLVAGGETTVTLRGDGSGGRNQEMALSAVAELAGLPDLALVTLATDGGDGPTDAAGAVVTGETLSRAQNLGLGPEDYLSRNNAYHFFAPLGDLLKPGPTQTNVNDLAFIFAF